MADKNNGMVDPQDVYGARNGVPERNQLKNSERQALSQSQELNEEEEKNYRF